VSNNAIGFSQQIADFVAKAEFDRQQMQKANDNVYQRLQEKSQEISQQLKSIASEAGHFKALMSRVGAAEFHRVTEKLLHEGKQEIETIQTLYHQTHQAVAHQCEQMNKASMNTIKHVSQLLSSAKHSNMHKLTEDKTHELQDECKKNLSAVERTARSFHWKNLCMSVILSLVVATIVSLYIDDEWPWQSHEQVVKQRQAGKVLLNSWKTLSPADKEVISTYA